MTNKFLIIFGKTLSTASEAYEICYPYSKLHRDEDRSISFNEVSFLRKTLLQIIANENLKNHTQNQLPVMNTFCLIKMNSSENIIDSSELTHIRNFKLNSSCKKFTINFRDTNEFQIFQEEFDELNLNESVLSEKDHNSQLPENTQWYQSKIYIKGFQDNLVNNKSIWN